MAVRAHNALTASLQKAAVLRSNFSGVTPAPQYSPNLASKKVTVKQSPKWRQKPGIGWWCRYQLI
jgi:hypothetical protein